MTQPLDYHSPGSGPSRRKTILSLLTRADAFSAAAVAGRLAIGVPLTFLLPLFITWILFAICRPWDLRLPLTFWSAVVLVSAIVVPLLLRFERRTSGNSYLEASRGVGSSTEAKSYGEWELTTTHATLNAYLEIGLTGPRLIWEAVDLISGRNRGGGETLLAAEIVERLLEAGQAVEVAHLRESLQRSPEEMAKAIALLQHLHWADLSRDRKRLWLQSAAARQLQTAIGGLPRRQ